MLAEHIHMQFTENSSSPENQFSFEPYIKFIILCYPKTVLGPTTKDLGFDFDSTVLTYCYINWYTSHILEVDADL